MKTLELTLDALEKKAKEYSRDERKEIADNIVSDFLHRTGRIPKEEYLLRLSNVILHEELTDKSRTKSMKAEYPFLSERQLQRRKGIRSSRRKDLGVALKEVSLKHASNVAIDGVDYSLPIRSFVNPG